MATGGVFVAALDQTVILTAIPEMLQDVNVGLTQLDQASWIVTGYLLGYVCVLPLMGRMSDVYGRRAVYLWALLIFALGSLACATARTLPWLVAARIIQAIGGGALLPVTFAVVADRLPTGRRALALGVVGAAAEAGGVLGPLYGAGIVQQWGWRWIFWLNIPVALAIGVAAYAALETRRKEWRESSVDYSGAALLALALSALTIGLSGSSDPTTSASPIALRRAVPLTALAIAAGALFAWRQSRAKEPLIPLRLFAAAANWVNVLVGVALIAAMVDVPLFAATVLGRSPLVAGLALLRLTVFIPLAAIGGGWLAGRLPWRLVAVAGLLLAAAGVFLMSRWSLDVTDQAMTPGLVLAGIGFGLVIAPVTAAVLQHAREGERALSTALLTVMRVAGMTVGLAGLTSVAFFRFQQLARGLVLPIPKLGEAADLFNQRLAAYEAGLTHAALEVFTGVFAVAAAVCVANCVVALCMGGGRGGSSTLVSDQGPAGPGVSRLNTNERSEPRSASARV